MNIVGGELSCDFHPNELIMFIAISILYTMF